MNLLARKLNFFFSILQGAGEVIPGGATLFFDIELIDTEEGPAPVNVFKQIDIDADSALSREELSVYLKQQVNYYSFLCLQFRHFWYT